MSELKIGDRVKVTFEGTVGSTGGVRIDGSDYTFGKDSILAAAKSIEKIEPPVEVFKRGDVVRDKRDNGYVYLITDDGYVELAKSIRGWHYQHTAPFTSEHYERVDLNVG